MAEDLVENFLFQQVPVGDLQMALVQGGQTQKLRNWIRQNSIDCSYVTAANTTSFTATTAQILGADVVNVLNLTGTLASGQNITLPTVASIAAANTTLFLYDPAVPLGESFLLDIYNSSGGAFSWTVVTNTGWTLNGTLTIAQNTYRRFLCNWTSVGTITAQSLGQIAFTAL